MFRPFLRWFVLVFFDDILIYSRSWNDHTSHLREVLQVLQDNCFFVKQSKCLFGQTQIDYLGHVISIQGVSMDPTKVQAVLDWPTPRTVTDVRGFLGLAGYYRRFIHHFATIASSLTDLLRKDGFVWTEKAWVAFREL